MSHNRAHCARFFYIHSPCYNFTMSINGNAHNSPGSHAGADDTATRIHRDQAKHNLENRIRVLRNRVIEKDHMMHELERIKALRKSVAVERSVPVAAFHQAGA